MAALARSALSTPTLRSTVSRDDATMRASPVMAVKAPAASAKFALQGDFMKGHGSLSMSKSAVVAERTALRISCGESRIGKQSVPLPKGVTYEIKGQTLTVKGKLGELSHTFNPEVKVVEEDGALWLKKQDESRQTKALHGLSRALTFNMVKGVSDGWTKNLELVGVGYRAAMQGTKLQMSLGFSHPVIFDPPAGIKIAVEGNTKVAITGADKSVVGNFAATIRDKRPPEPYKGKGVKYADEYILRKEGKTGK